MSMLRAAIIGAVAAVLVVAVLVALVGLHVVPVGDVRSASTNGPVAVALVLPDTTGVVTLRALDVYTRSGGSWSVQSVLPTTAVVVPGTSGSTLADAYSFGGGEGLTRAIGTLTGHAVTAWIVVDEKGLGELRGGAPFSIDVPSDIAVFDGNRLFSFGTGAVSVPTTQAPELLDGAAYLRAGDSRLLRAEVGDVVRSSLYSAGSGIDRAVGTNLSAAALRGWSEQIKLAGRIPGT